MNNNPPNHHRNFKGSIDDLLNHVDKIDANQVEKELVENVPLADEEHIDTIMADFNCSEEDANRILQEMKLDQTIEMVDKLVEGGFLEVKGHDENGDPKFGATEFGKLVLEEEKKRREGNA